ncbi:MAG: cytochrome c biogenesis heme-transporting ATPase CcmA [Telluria sp.]|nr:cytochrome c biogenesis heme-transporting ATPase CcmA [Telluria sp.]
MMLQAHELGCTRGERRLFNNINFELAAGQALRVAGSNGSGKTSLLRMLCALACPAEGEVLWGGRNVRALREQFGASVIYLGHAPGVKDDLAAWENLVVACTLAGSPVSREQACDALAALGLGLAAELPARSLSQGQRKRVALARLQLGAAQPLWILDEPFTALDQDAVDALCLTLERHLARGGMLVYTTHQDVALGGAALRRLDLDREGAC